MMAKESACVFLAAQDRQLHLVYHGVAHFVEDGKQHVAEYENRSLLMPLLRNGFELRPIRHHRGDPGDLPLE